MIRDWGRDSFKGFHLAFIYGKWGGNVTVLSMYIPIVHLRIGNVHWEVGPWIYWIHHKLGLGRTPFLSVPTVPHSYYDSSLAPQV
jgi:hypothetical protein